MAVDRLMAVKQHTAVSEGLCKLLADTYTLQMKTQYFHWNVTGAQFDTLHRLFERQYEKLFAACDDLAERIRALGHVAPSGYSEYGRQTRIEEPNGSVPSAHDMLGQLLKDHEVLEKEARAMLDICRTAKDPVTEDLVIERMEAHDRMAWQLRSLFEGEQASRG